MRHFSPEMCELWLCLCLIVLLWKIENPNVASSPTQSTLHFMDGVVAVSCPIPVQQRAASKSMLRNMHRPRVWGWAKVNTIGERGKERGKVNMQITKRKLGFPFLFYDFERKTH